MKPANSSESPTRPPAAVLIAAFVSSFDRFAVSPLLVLIATDLGATLSQTLIVASGYFLAYGLSQPIWGVLSDRFGRIRLMQITLLAAALTGIVATAAPGLLTLILARIFSGVFSGAVVPASLTYVGDTVDESHRQPALTDLMAAVAVGTAVATALAGLVAEFSSWRVVFAIPVVLSVISAFGLRRLHEAPREVHGGILAPIRDALRNKWVLVVIALAFGEGVVVLGVLTLLAPALQSQGVGAVAAGLATAAYGVGVILTSRLVRGLSRRLSMTRLMSLGGLAVVLGYALLTVHLSIWTVLIAALLLGVTWSFLHSSLQTWSTSVLPRARGTVVSLFAGFLFAGSSVGASAGGHLGNHGMWTQLFGITTVVALVLIVLVVLSRRAYDGPQRNG